MRAITTTPTPEVPTIPPTLDAPAVTQAATLLLERIERGVRTLRDQLHHVPTDLDAVVDHVESNMRAEDPFYARKLAVRAVALAEQGLTDLDTALSDARIAQADHAAALRRLATVAADRRARLEVLGDADDPEEKQRAHAQLAHGRLERLLAQVGPWMPEATAAVAVLAQASVIVLARDRVAQLQRELEALRMRREVLTTADAHDTDAATVLARMVKRVGHPLPVPSLRWPTGTDPFAPPVLEARPRAV